MTSVTLRAKRVVKGRAAGEALVADATLSFWGEVDAAADLPGRYEVVVTMPQGVAAGDAAAVISVAGQTSPATATIAAR
jgi:predicted aconitase with swiveling domain